ncbi:hypothetical protein GQ600_17569 [Phytophthora cactorum]|nr:hypothetical protein GQ600_17569 [Phytophthora cactorum]
MGVLLVLMFGIAPFRSNSPLRPHLTKFLHFLTVHVNLLPSTLFLKLSTPSSSRASSIRAAAAPCLEMWSKKYVGRAMHELEDYIPQIVGFRCGLLQHALRLRVHVQFWLCFGVGTGYCFGYFVLFVGISRASGNAMSSATCYEIIKTGATTTYPTTDRFEILKALATLDVFGSPAYHSVPTKAHISFISNSPGKLQTRRVSVAAIGPTDTACVAFSPESQMVEDSERSRKLITQGLQLLFQCEYLVLVEYIEGIVPIVFVAYQLVLYQLPNIVYAPGGAEGWQSVGD